MTNPTAPSRRRAPGLKSRLLLVLLALSTVLAMVTTVPAVATEGESTEAPATTEATEEAGAAEGGAEAAEEGGKLTISDNPHDQFGLILFGLMGLAALAMGANAVKQLRGQRPQADGRIRWR